MSDNVPSPFDTLAALQTSLDQCRAGTLPAAVLAGQWRGETALLAALPSRYAPVLENILVRLESSSLFSEESCSFSQRDLFDALQEWLDKAASVGATVKSE